MLRLITPAPDRALATLPQMRVAAGLAAGNIDRDAELTSLALAISAQIVDACGIPATDTGEPTLRQETVEQTFDRSAGPLVLARRHNIEIVSVAEDGVALALDSRAVDSEAGMIHRWSGGHLSRWYGLETVIRYKAGFAVVPTILSSAVTDMAKIVLAASASGQIVKGRTVEIPDVETVTETYWVDQTSAAAAASGSSGLPVGMAWKLRRFMNSPIA